MMLNKTGPNTERWGSPLVTDHQLDLTPFTTTLGLAIQPFLYPAKSIPIQTMGSYFLQKDAVGSSVKIIYFQAYVQAIKQYGFIRNKLFQIN